MRGTTMTKKKHIKCEQCGAEVEECIFASYETNIGNQTYVFCCKSCAERFKPET